MGSIAENSSMDESNKVFVAPAPFFLIIEMLPRVHQLLMKFNAVFHLVCKGSQIFSKESAVNLTYKVQTVIKL